MRPRGGLTLVMGWTGAGTTAHMGADIMGEIRGGGGGKRGVGTQPSSEGYIGGRQTGYWGPQPGSAAQSTARTTKGLTAGMMQKSARHTATRAENIR